MSGELANNEDIRRQINITRSLLDRMILLFLELIVMPFYIIIHSFVSLLTY